MHRNYKRGHNYMEHISEWLLSIKYKGDSRRVLCSIKELAVEHESAKMLLNITGQCYNSNEAKRPGIIFCLEGKRTELDQRCKVTRARSCKRKKISHPNVKCVEECLLSQRKAALCFAVNDLGPLTDTIQKTNA